MSRVQLALRVADLEGSIAFYTKLFGVEPAKRRPGYANFAVAQPPRQVRRHLRGPGRRRAVRVRPRLRAGPRAGHPHYRRNERRLLLTRPPGRSGFW